jgi:hypothetical protein
MRSQLLFLFSTATIFSLQLLAVEENQLPEKLKTVYVSFLNPHYVEAVAL